MGCYHFHLNQLSRGKGQSAIASAAYRAGTKPVSYTHLLEIIYERIQKCFANEEEE